MRKLRMRGVIAVAALVLSTAVGISAGASASDEAPPNGKGVSKVVSTVVKPVQPLLRTDTDCFNGRLCLWTDGNYTGALGMYAPQPIGQCYSMGVMNNDTESLWNKTGTCGSTTRATAPV